MRTCRAASGCSSSYNHKTPLSTHPRFERAIARLASVITRPPFHGKARPYGNINAYLARSNLRLLLRCQTQQSLGIFGVRSTPAWPAEVGENDESRCNRSLTRGTATRRCSRAMD
jgi:hypothetical protein